MTGTWTRRGAAALAAGLAAGVAAIGFGAAPAGAGGGDWVFPVQDRYEAGQDVLMVGYVPASMPLDLSGGPWCAWLGTARVAPVVIEPGRSTDTWFGQRASIAFTLPADLAPGHYTLNLCGDPRAAPPGNLFAELLNVGLAPEYDNVRDWPASEPAIRWLDDDALLFAPDHQPVRAADYRAGRSLRR